MKAALNDRRLAALEQAQARQAQMDAMRLHERQCNAAVSAIAFARGLFLEAMKSEAALSNPLPGMTPAAGSEASASGVGDRLSLSPEERRAAEVERLRPLLKGYQIDSCEALRLMGKYPELGIVKGWKEPEPPPRPPSWAPDPFHSPPHPDDPWPGGGFIRPSYYVSRK
jgi:hypothetical protein